MAATPLMGETHSDLTDHASRPFLDPNLPSYDIVKTLQHFDFLCTEEGLVGWARWRLQYYSPSGAGLCCDGCLLTRNLDCEMREGGYGCRTCKDRDIWCRWNNSSPQMPGPTGEVLHGRYNNQHLSTACDRCRDGRESACDPWSPGGCHVCRQHNMACQIGGNTVGSLLEVASRADPSRPDHLLDWDRLLANGRELIRLAGMPDTKMVPQLTKFTVFSFREPDVQQKLVNNLRPLPPAPGHPPAPGGSQFLSGAPVWQQQQHSVGSGSIDPRLLYQEPAPAPSNANGEWAPDPNDSYGLNDAPAVDKGKAPERPYSLSSQPPVDPDSDILNQTRWEGYIPDEYAGTEPPESYPGLPIQPEVTYPAPPPQPPGEYYTAEELPDYSHVVPIPRKVEPLRVVWEKGRPKMDRCVGCMRAHNQFRGPCGYRPTQGCLRCARYGIVCVKNGFALPPHSERPTGPSQTRFGRCHACRDNGRFCDPSHPCLACATCDPPALCERSIYRGLVDRPVPGDSMRGFTELWTDRPPNWKQPINYHVELARKWCEEKGQQWPGPDDIESLPPQNGVWVGDWDPAGPPPPRRSVQSSNQASTLPTPSPVQTPTPVQTPVQVANTLQPLPQDPTPSAFAPASAVTPPPSLGASPDPGHWRADLPEIPNVPALQNWVPGSKLPNLPPWLVEAATPGSPVDHVPNGHFGGSPTPVLDEPAGLPYGVLIASGANGNQGLEQEIQPFEPFGSFNESLQPNPYPDPTTLAPASCWDWNDAANEGDGGRKAQDGGPVSHIMPLAFVENLHVPDKARLNWYWKQASAPRRVSVQPDELSMAQHITPLDDRTIEAATAVPVERAPSPPPPALPYAGHRIGAIPADDVETSPGLALIPLKRLWEPNGQLSGLLDLPGRAKLTGGCQAFVQRREGPTDLCDTPCQAMNNPDSGGVCESTEHHPEQRVWVCDEHDEQGRALASLLLDQEDGGYIWAALRHYACADCCEEIRCSGGREFAVTGCLAGSGCRIFTARPASMADPQRAEEAQPSSDEGGRVAPTRGGRYGLFPGTGCGCLTKVTARRLCPPHRLAACLEVRRRHPLTWRYDAAHGALCPFCEKAPSVDPAELPADLRELTWMCKCCFGIVTGVPVDPVARQLRRPQSVRPEHEAGESPWAPPPRQNESHASYSSHSTIPLDD